MKKSRSSFDQYRRKIRRELFLKRQSDHDNSEARLFIDARKLDAQLIQAGYALIYQTEWAQTINHKRHLERSKKGSPSTPAVWQTDLNPSEMAK